MMEAFLNRLSRRKSLADLENRFDRSSQPGEFWGRGLSFCRIRKVNGLVAFNFIPGGNFGSSDVVALSALLAEALSFGRTQPAQFAESLKSPQSEADSMSEGSVACGYQAHPLTRSVKGGSHVSNLVSNRGALSAFLGVALFVLCAASTAFAQPPPSPEPGGGALASAAQPVPTSPVESTPEAPPTREQQLEARIQQLESMVNRLSNQVQQINAPPAAGGAPNAAAAGGAPNAAASAMGPSRPGTAAGGGLPTPGGMGSNAPALPSPSGGLNAPGQSLPPNPSPNARWDSPATLENHPGIFKFGPGFELRTNDEEFIFQFHNLTQFEYRGYEQGGQSTVKDSFLFPRQWFMFSGRITKPIGYFLSIAEGFDTTNILDVFVDYNFSPKFTIRAGRMKTPFTYEFLVEPIQGLIIPERSLFFNNFGQNRDMGVMAYGRIFDNKLDYAAGIFNGTRNGFVAVNNSKSVSAFINWRPFADEEETLLENFNVGGSVFAAQGLGQNIPNPAVLRTTVATSGNAVAGVPFMTYNNNARESGNRVFWDLHMAYFYRSLAVIAEWQSGFQDYSLAGTPQFKTNLPVESYYVQAGYLLTGETRSSVGIVKPLHPFDITGKTPGWGAWEVTGRYDYLGMGKDLFTNGLADPNNNTNHLYMTDLGLNWHVNQYVKIYFDWQHAVFGEPVLFAPGRRQLTSDTFLLRAQLYF